jgi:hypothetical protein
LAFIAVAGFWPRFPQFCHPSRSRSSRERFCGRICVVTLLDGEDAQIHSADKFPMSRGNSCPRFCHGYGADTRFGLRSRRLAPRSCVYCKQSTANKSTANKSTANNPMQTIQCKQSNCHPERSEGSRFLRRGLDYVREFSPHTLTDGSPCVQKPTNRGCPRKLGYVPSVSRFPVPGFKLSSRAQRGIPVSSALLRLR